MLFRSIFWQHSVVEVGAGLATVLANMQVIVVALTGWALLHERPRLQVFVGLPIVVAGAALISGVLDRHCADVGRDPAEIRRSVQFRFDGDAESALRTVQSYVAVGIDDVIVMLMGGRAQEHAEGAADLLPRLKELEKA